jgi:hypothetical protein
MTSLRDNSWLAANGLAVRAGLVAASSDEALHAFDLNARPLWTLPIEGERGLMISEPAISSEGVVRVAVHDWETELFIVGARRDGTRLPQISLGSEYPIIGSDLAPKLIAAIHATDDGFLVSYRYRHRDFFVAKFVADQPAWTAPEWVEAVAHDKVLTREHDDLICRALKDGRELWRRPSKECCVAHPFVIVDYASSLDRMDADALERLLESEAEPPCDVITLDPATGAELSRRKFPGPVVSLHPAGDAIVRQSDRYLLNGEPISPRDRPFALGNGQWLDRFIGQRPDRALLTKANVAFDRDRMYARDDDRLSIIALPLQTAI